jgi:hypothetical protein
MTRIMRMMISKAGGGEHSKNDHPSLYHAFEAHWKLIRCHCPIEIENTRGRSSLVVPQESRTLESPVCWHAVLVPR